MARCELTNAAAQDFQNILDFGIERFGLTQAIEYQNGVSERVEDSFFRTCSAAVTLRVRG